MIEKILEHRWIFLLGVFIGMWIVLGVDVFLEWLAKVRMKITIRDGK